MKEYSNRSTLEKRILITGISLLTFALMSCNGAIAINETTVWYGNDQMRNDKFVVAHEACHQKQMKDIGGASIFWDKYWDEDNTFRCESELACGETEKHFACQDLKLKIQKSFAAGEIISAP